MGWVCERRGFPVLDKTVFLSNNTDEAIAGALGQAYQAVVGSGLRVDETSLYNALAGARHALVRLRGDTLLSDGTGSVNVMMSHKGSVTARVAGFNIWSMSGIQINGCERYARSERPESLTPDESEAVANFKNLANCGQTISNDPW